MTTRLKAQSSQICFTRTQAEQIHRQQIRLKYCDSIRVKMVERMTALETVIEAQEHSIVTLSEQLQVNEDHKEHIRQQLALSEKERKKLARKNQLMKYGLYGLGGSTIILLGIVLAK